MIVAGHIADESRFLMSHIANVKVNEKEKNMSVVTLKEDKKKR